MAVKSLTLQKKALKSCAAIMVVLGVSIMIIGLIFELHGDFSKIADARPSNIYHIMYPHTQYWLGLPVSERFYHRTVKVDLECLMTIFATF